MKNQSKIFAPRKNTRTTTYAVEATKPAEELEENENDIELGATLANTNGA